MTTTKKPPRLTKKLRRVLISCATWRAAELRGVIINCTQSLDHFKPAFQDSHRMHIAKIQAKVDLLEIAIAALEAQP